MTFFTRIDISGLGNKSVSRLDAENKGPKDNPCKLRVFIDPDTGKYRYEFMETAFILWDADDTITFELENMIANTDATIITHLSTDHEDHTGKKKVILVDHTAADPPKAQPIAKPDEHYKNQRPKKARYKLDIKPYELVHIGLIVEIVHVDTSKRTEYLLCDPQVGNGPPQNNA